jgi:hypothetical protein
MSGAERPKAHSIPGFVLGTDCDQSLGARGLDGHALCRPALLQPCVDRLLAADDAFRRFGSPRPGDRNGDRGAVGVPAALSARRCGSPPCGALTFTSGRSALTEFSRPSRAGVGVSVAAA